jgi:hypothetical protein
MWWYLEHLRNSLETDCEINENHVEHIGNTQNPKNPLHTFPFWRKLASGVHAPSSFIGFV